MRHSPVSSVGASRRLLNHAVVLGGSIAGLLAARVLSDHFAHVTVVERDARAQGSEPRKGVPQGHHIHALLARGRMIADALLPGLSDELLAAGAVRLHAGHDFAWHHAGGWRVRHGTALTFMSMSRPLLESQIGKRVAALPNVTILDDIRVASLRTDGDRRVSGVRFAKPGSAGQASEIEADLVVDAMGRGSSVPQWLADFGFPVPPTETAGARVTYTTCTFRRDQYGPDWRALVISGKPVRRGGLVFPIEGNRWLVTLPGLFDEPIPHDHATFLAYARSLAVPDLHDLIRGCEPLSAIKHYRFAGSLRRHYEQLDSPPEGLIALGDAVSSFNPVYGQGMTVSAIEAEMLGQMLGQARAEGGLRPDFARTWFHAIKPVVDAAWNGGLVEDLRLPELANQRPLHLRPLQWYMDHVQRATHRSAFATDQFYRVINFLDPPERLFSARMIAEVMRASFGGSHGNVAPHDTALHQAPHVGGSR